MRTRKAKEFGWKRRSREWIYKLGLYSDYRVRYYKPKASPVQYRPPAKVEKKEERGKKGCKIINLAEVK